MRMEAEFSEDRKYRFSLERIWDESCNNRFVVIGLNPSTADEKVDDPTIRRCISFAQSASEQFNRRFGGLIMLNLFAYRSRDPRKLREVKNPEGQSYNDKKLYNTLYLKPGVKIFVAAWGVRGNFRTRDETVRRVFHLNSFKLHTFGLTKDGHPKHPLYLPSNTKLVEWPYDHR